MTHIRLNTLEYGMEEILESSKSQKTAERSAAMSTPSEVEQVIERILPPRKLRRTQDSFNKVLVPIVHFVKIGAPSPKFASPRMFTDSGLEGKVGDFGDGCFK